MRRITKWLRDFIETVDPENRTEVTGYLLAMKEKYKNPATFRKLYFQIRRFLRQEYDVHYLDYVKLPQVQIPPVKPLSHENVASLLAWFSQRPQKRRYEALIRLAYDTGCRPGELIQLQKADLDTSQMKLYIRKDSSHSVKNKNAIRTCYYTRSTARVLEDYIEHCNTKRLWNQSSVSRAFKGSPLSPKMLRKAFSQRAEKAGLPTHVKKMLMGHSLSNDVDMMHYNKLTDEQIEDWYRRCFK